MTFQQAILAAWQEHKQGTLERPAPWQKHQGVKVENIGFWLERLYLARERIMGSEVPRWMHTPWGAHVLEELHHFADWYAIQPAYDPDVVLGSGNSEK